MPSAEHHQLITGMALNACAVKDAELLVEDYCLWPDCLHSRYAEIAPYMFMIDGVDFHYLPHTPVEDFYRYWQYIPGVGVRLKPMAKGNDNQRFAENGFTFYLQNIADKLQAGERDEAWKFLGILLHTLEDQAFGIHALEGPDGTDVFVLDRLSGMPVAKYLCAIPFAGIDHDFQVTPEVFANNVPEAAALLYHRYAASSSSSRQALFRMAMEFISGKTDESVIRKNEKIMLKNAVQLAADTIATVLAVANGTFAAPEEVALTGFEPFFYPIGGGGNFPLRKAEFTQNQVTFGVNHEAKLLYHIPEGVYREFQAEFSGAGLGEVEIILVNNGDESVRYRLAGNNQISCRLKDPGGVFGIILRNISGRGEFSVTGGRFFRR